MTAKSLVCVNILPSLDCVEIIKIQGSIIERAGSFPVFFNMESRSIENEAEMAEILKVLYEAHRIPISTPTVLVLPSYFTSESPSPLKASDDEIYEKILSEVEEKPVFKKRPVQLDWVRFNRGELLYSAYPKDEIDKYTRIFHHNKTPLISIDLNYLSILRALIATGAIDSIIDSNKHWLLMTISDHIFFTAKFRGIQMLHVMEMPILKNTDFQTTFNTIKEDIDEFLGDFLEGSKDNRQIIWVDNTEKISSKELLSTLGLTDKVTIISQTEESLRSRGEGDGKYPCSLEAIGGAFYSEYSGLPFLDFASQNEDEFMAFANTRRKMFKSIMGLNVAACLVVFFLFLLAHFTVAEKGSQLEHVSRQIHKVDQQLALEPLEDATRQVFISRMLESNMNINNLVIHTAQALPREMWITRMALKGISKSQETLSIKIEGKSTSKKPLRPFLKNLTSASKKQNLTLEKTKNNDPEKHYHWRLFSPSVPFQLSKKRP